MQRKQFLALLLTLALALCLCACGEQDGVKEKAGAQTVIEETLQAISNGDSARIQAVLFTDAQKENALYRDMTGTDAALARYGTLLYQNLSWDVLSQKETDKTHAVVTAKIKNIDMEKLLPQYVERAITLSLENYTGGAALSEQEMADKLYAEAEKLFGAEDAPYTESTADVALEKKDGNWTIVPDDGWINAVTGNLLSATQTLSEPAQPVQ